MSLFHTWWLWFAGFGSIGIFIALAIFAPSVLPVLAAFFQPIAKSIGDGVAWTVAKVFSILEVGISDILDTWQTLFTVVFFAVCLTWFVHPKYDVVHCKTVIEDLHAHFKFIPRPGAISYHLPAWASWL